MAAIVLRAQPNVVAERRRVEDPEHPTVEGFAFGDLRRADWTVLEFDHQPARRLDVGAVGTDDAFLPVRREAGFPADVPGRLRFAPWITFAVSGVRPMPGDDLPTLGD